MNDKNMLEKIILPGLLPLVAGTTSVAQAIIFALSCIVLVVIVKILYRVLSNILPQEPGEILWIILLSLGLSFSFAIYIILPEILPFTGEHINIYLMFLGLTPVIYIGSESKNWGFRLAYILAFAALIVLTGTVREFIGQGKIMGLSIIDSAVIPIIKGPVGGFMIPGLLWLLIEMVFAGEEAGQ